MKIFGFEIKRIKKPQQKRNYVAAKVNNLTADWLTNNLTSDEILRYSLQRIRDRSRDLERNDDYMRNFLRKLEMNVIGAKGIVMQSKVKFKVTGELDIKTNLMLENGWAKWGKRYASVCETLSFRDFCKLLIRTVARDGECFIRLIRGYDNPFGFSMQIFEADYVDEKLNQELTNGNRIVLGVEKNKYGKPVAYWFFEKHPGDKQFAGNRYIRIPADEIIHVFVKERPTQTRGVPWIVSAMMKLRMVGAYEEAEVIAARVSAAKMGFFTESVEGLSYGGEVDSFGNVITEVEPGLLERLPPGVDFKPFDPGSPNSEFGDFVKAMLRGISAGLGCNYNTLCNDLESVNYSSLRAGSIEEREYWKDIQQWFIDNFLERVYPAWLEMAALSGQIQINFSEIDRYISPEWQPRRWDWVDPLNDVKAKLLELKNGLTTRTKILAEKGIDFEDVLEELKREKDLMEKYGIKITDVDDSMAMVLETATEETFLGGGNGDKG